MSTEHLNRRKECVECLEEKPLWDFYTAPWEDDGHMPVCRMCQGDPWQTKHKPKYSS